MRFELQQATVELGGRTVLREIDLTLDADRATVVLARSGSGASVLLKTLKGLIALTGGRVLVDGRDLATLGAAEARALQTRSGFVFQDAALWANMSIEGNLGLPLQVKHSGLDQVARRARIDALLRRFAFPVDLQARPAALSLGESRIVSFLRAVIPHPEALFLDDPTAALDHRYREAMIDMLRELRAGGVTLVATSHDPVLIHLLADRLVVLHAGRILADGPRDEVLASTRPEVQAILSDGLARDGGPAARDTEVGR